MISHESIIFRPCILQILRYNTHRFILYFSLFVRKTYTISIGQAFIFYY